MKNSKKHIKKCKCWICKLAGVQVSKKLENYIMDNIGKQAKYHIAFYRLGSFLIGEKRFCEISDRNPDYINNPLDFALAILSHCGEANRPAYLKGSI